MQEFEAAFACRCGRFQAFDEVCGCESGIDGRHGRRRMRHSRSGVAGALSSHLGSAGQGKRDVLAGGIQTH